MWNNKLPIRFCGVLTFLLAANAAQLSNFMPIRYYHYPTPQHQLTIPQAAATTTQQRYQQQQYASYAQTQQRYVPQQTQQQYYQQYQQNQQQASQQAATSYYQHTQQLPAATATNVAQQFTAPALENAAFTTALTNQGYKYGSAGNSGSGISNNHAASSVSAARALPSSILPLPSSLVEALEAANDIAPKGAIDTTDTSINLKLPLPVNIAPIKVSPLPLDEGVSFNKLANNGVTSYGTVYPQRKRR